MLPKLFDIENDKIIPTEHCYALHTLKVIMDKYKKDKQYLKVYQYLFYMTCPSAEVNIYFNSPEHEREDLILKELKIDFSLEDLEVIEGLKFCRKMYDTPTARAYRGIKVMLDNLAEYMEETEITGGRDGNITALVNAAKNYQAIRESFKGVEKDLKEEQDDSSVRGGKNLAYDE